MITLGIETSCDETALALIETRLMAGGTEEIFECRVINSLINSQAELHSAYGGVYPNLAKREHGKNLLPLLKKLLAEAPVKAMELAADKLISTLDSFRAELSAQNPDLLQTFESPGDTDFLRHIPSIDRIAVTEGPGLEPTLWVGINFARVIGTLWNIPIVPVNHMEGHIVGSLLNSDASHGKWQTLKPLPLPSIALLISGGHTELVKIDRLGDYTTIGQTKDDAVGEAFDKVARLLGLPYPGGPHISKLSKEAAEQNIPSPVILPRPMIHSGNLDFSFSGLKTTVLYAVRKHADANGKLTDQFKKGLAHEFETAVTETLDAKLRAGIEQVDAKSIIIGGGVSANEALRKQFEITAKEYGIPIYMPSKHVSGDNALMIALAGALDSTVHSGHLKAHGTKRLGKKSAPC